MTGAFIHHLAYPAIVLTAAVASMGCRGNAIERYAISGNVTYDGQPVPAGTIRFSPDTDPGNSGPASAAEIVDGAYAIDRERGVVGGPYVVLITAYGGPPVEVPGEGVTAPGKVLCRDQEIRIELAKRDAEQDFDLP